LPTPSKFVEARRRLLLAAAAAGASRRTAARLAQIDHETLARWLRRGEGAAEGSRWRRFSDAFLAAERDPKLAAFPVIKEPLSARELGWAMRLAEREWRQQLEPEDPTEPRVIQLGFGERPDRI